MNKKKKIIIFTVILLIIVFATSANVYADNEWLAAGEKVTCGNITNIPKKIPDFTSACVNVVNIVVPVFLVIFGVIDLIKGMMSGKEDEIKKGQQSLIKRVITGACVFLIVIAVKFLVSVVDENSDNKANIISCINCFVSGECTTS